jgi:hypothetical protein
VTKGAERTRWKIRSDRKVDETPQVRLSIASLELANGFTFEQYVMRLPRCAMTVVLDDSAERILLIWRHRFIVDRWMWELPGGYIDPGEDGIVAATWSRHCGRYVYGTEPRPSRHPTRLRR